MEKVIAFGAGNFYRNRKEEIEKAYDIVAFCDNDSEKQGMLFDNKPVISLAEAGAYGEIGFLITSTYRYEIIKQLVQNGVEEKRISFWMPAWMKQCDYVAVYGEGVKVCCNGIAAVLHNVLEEMIYREIWYNEEYNLNISKESIVIDIGMNAGFATLFFAQKEFVKKVYAFEPDKIMYEKAQENINLNTKLKDKIVTDNVACANEDKKEIYVVNPRESAGVVKRRETTSTNAKEMEVVCVDSAKALGTIIDSHYGKEKILMKCDCEGAEYEIFYRLEEMGYFDKIDAVVMEWHIGRREEIEKIFARNGYTYIIYNIPGRDFGKCYAIKGR